MVSKTGGHSISETTLQSYQYSNMKMHKIKYACKMQNGIVKIALTVNISKIAL